MAPCSETVRQNGLFDETKIWFVRDQLEMHGETMVVFVAIEQSSKVYTPLSKSLNMQASMWLGFLHTHKLTTVKLDGEKSAVGDERWENTFSVQMATNNNNW